MITILKDKILNIGFIGQYQLILQQLEIKLAWCLLSPLIIIFYCKLMEKLLGQLQQFPSWKEVLRVSCRNNSLKTSLANSLTPIKIRSLYARLLKTYQMNKEKARTCWFENQLRAYHWILIVVSAIDKTLISEFNETEWEMLSNIFQHKQTYVLQYEAIRLNPKKTISTRPWGKEEQQVLNDVITGKQTSNKWNDVARLLFKQSFNKFYRTGKQCRERWLNHLDPNKKRGQWTIDEDKTISKYILEQGKKWSQIARVLGHSRTQHMVKNRFKSLMIRQKKIHSKVTSETELLKSVLSEDYIKRQSISSVQEEQESYQEMQSEQIDKQQVQQECKQSRKLKQQKHSFMPVAKLKEKKVSKGFSVVSPSSDANNNNAYRTSRSQRSILSPGCDLAELDPILRAQIIQNDRPTEDKQENKNQTFQLQQIFSPFCVAYTSNGNLTPIYSPPPSIPFFMGFRQGSFGQGCINNFGFFLNQNQSGSQGNNGPNQDRDNQQ